MKDETEIRYDDLKIAVNGALMVFGMAQMTLPKNPTTDEIDKMMSCAYELAGKVLEGKGYKINRSAVQ